MKPIYNLLKSDRKFIWSKECESAFIKIKNIIASDSVLVHFNPELPIIITTDASDAGVSGVMSHLMQDGQERLVSCVSRTFMPAEENYPSLHKEALAIYYTVVKYSQFLQGRKFVLRTDCKPLLGIFGKGKGIPQMHANRIQKWSVYLSSFSYEMEHISGKNNVLADYLSRAPVKTKVISEENSGKSMFLNFTASQEDWPINNEDIRRKTSEDKKLRQIVKYVEQEDWPSRISTEIRPYYIRREELYVENGVLMWGYRMVIPKALQSELLGELHFYHFGMVKTKALARSYIYWPNIDQDIELTCRRCDYCQQNKSLPPKTDLTPWRIEKAPWQRIHIDYLGPVQGKMLLLMVDAFSKWIELMPVNSMSSLETEEKLKDVLPGSVCQRLSYRILQHNLKQQIYNRC